MLFSSRLQRYIFSVITSSFVIFSAESVAGGFQLWEQDAADIGDYHAGAAAEADIAASTFYNPAGATRLSKQEASLGVTLIPLDLSFTGTVDGVVPVNNAPGDTLNAVPNFQYVLPLPHRFAFSFGVTAPFGLSTNYPDVNFVNYLATETQLETVNINPAIAYAINQYLSLGIGFDAMYGSAVYDSDPGVPLTSDLHGWNYGYNAGALVQFTPSTRMGLSYRSAVTITATGLSQSANFDGTPIVSTASAQFPLPATSILSFYQDVNSRFTLMASAFYTQWSAFNELVIQNLATPAGTGTIALFEKYRDTWNLAVGGKYKITQQVSLEAGFGHDQTPTQDGYRDIRLPDNDRYAASFGINIDPTTKFHWSMGWTHFFVPNTPVDNSQSNDTSRTTTLLPPYVGIGTVTGNINVVGMQLSYDIG